MGILPLSSFFCISLCSLLPLSSGVKELASVPPKGWNSYDSFSWVISEEEFLNNAELVSRHLRQYGYEYVVVDYLWYRRKVEGAYSDSYGFDVVDEWGRLMPDPGRWPSSSSGKGFTEVAEKVHQMGLKFGIHVMRGISRQAFDAKTPIYDVTTGRAYEESAKQWRANDIGISERECAWMKNGFMSVDTNLGAGRAFLRSLYQQYAEWGVDFVKHDCVFGADFDLAEITYVSQVLTELNRPLLYSLSPGTSVTSSMARDVSGLVNMYRITGDDWDTWPDVVSHFDITRELADANMIGAKGNLGRSWPDCDMLPLGWLTDAGGNQGPHRKSKLTPDEQRSQMTLWSMVRSPLMFGGDMRQLDESTLRLLSNPTLLEINNFSSDNREFHYMASGISGQRRKLLLEEQGVSSTLMLRLTSCEDLEARGWYTEAIEDEIERVCWKDELNAGREQFCLYQRKPLLSMGEGAIYKHEHHGKVQLLENNARGSCLIASPNQKVTSRGINAGMFSPCKWDDTNQMWELALNGTLMNSYSRLCASMPRSQAYSASKIRAWVATGRTGEIYLAFFNLGDEKVAISMTIQDVKAALPGKTHDFSACKCKEEWTQKDFGVVTGSFSTTLEIHGCALFVLSCPRG